jgi:hypothetical protein
MARHKIKRNKKWLKIHVAVDSTLYLNGGLESML